MLTDSLDLDQLWELDSFSAFHVKTNIWLFYVLPLPKLVVHNRVMKSGDMNYFFPMDNKNIISDF